MQLCRSTHTQRYGDKLCCSNTDGEVVHLALLHSWLTEDVKRVEIQLKVGWEPGLMLMNELQSRSQCIISMCCAEGGRDERTALMPQNWTPAQGMARVSSCHRTQREVRTSFTVFAFSPSLLSLSFCMSSSSDFSSSCCHSHCNAVIHHTHMVVTDVHASVAHVVKIYTWTICSIHSPCLAPSVSPLSM